MTEPSTVTDEGLVESVELNGVVQPKRIWLICYRHAGDVCWSADPNPDDEPDLETVEYVRADLASGHTALLREIEEWRGRCEYLLACVDVSNEAGAPVDESDPEDIAEIDFIRAALSRPLGADK